ncbi:hypothetical protein K439DRAFT_290467 [Ramaria rubella]|nr:hypothetical protein K439DRAFT_290467 [Ramaria rubella]
MLEKVSILIIEGLKLPHANTLTPLGLTGCHVSTTSSFHYFIWIPPLVFEAVLCLLMLYKARLAYKDQWQSRLMSILIKDSITYFILVFSVLTITCLLWALVPVIAAITLGWGLAVNCGLGSRLLLNVRKSWFSEESPPLCTYETDKRCEIAVE